MDYNNTAILATDKKHAKKIIAFYKSKGYDTSGFSGDSNYLTKYYGVQDNNFIYFGVSTPKAAIKIIELPTEYPRVMMVSLGSGRWFKRVVFMKKNNKYIAWLNAETLKEAEEKVSTCAWRYAKEVEEETTEITIEEVAKLLNKPKHLIKIIDK